MKCGRVFHFPPVITDVSVLEISFEIVIDIITRKISQATATDTTNRFYYSLISASENFAKNLIIE